MNSRRNQYSKDKCPFCEKFHKKYPTVCVRRVVELSILHPDLWKEMKEQMKKYIQQFGL